MTDYTWPSTIIPTSSEWRFISNTAAFSSSLSGVTRTLSRGGDRWACTIVCANLYGAQRAVLQAFIARLRGQVHRVVLPDHAYTRRGTQSANVLVKGAAQTGQSLIVDGGSANTTLLAGDMFSLSTGLHMIVTNATFSAGGEATLAFVPPLRSAPADNATVTVVAPTGRFILADNAVGWSNAGGGKLGALSTFTLDLVEDIA
jgi:hypothetical protein